MEKEKKRKKKPGKEEQEKKNFKLSYTHVYTLRASKIPLED
jgi:hypothetical protein